MTDEKKNVCGENVADADIISPKPDISGLYCLTGKPSDTSVPDVVRPENSPIIPETPAITPPIPPQVAPEPQTPEKQADIPETPKIVVSTPILSKEQEFIKALPILVADKFDPIIVYTQCSHETDKFRRLVGEWNYAGMKIPQKAIPPVPIKPIEVWTHEVINGRTIKLKDTFANFNSADDFMQFYMWQIKRLYKESYENRNSPQAYFYWLTHGINKWATDLSYSKKLEKLYADFRANGIYEKLNKLL